MTLSSNPFLLASLLSFLLSLLLGAKLIYRLLGILYVPPFNISFNPPIPEESGVIPL